MHTYIEYDTGLIYLLEKENKKAQIVIDDNLDDDCIAVSNKYIKDKENKNSIKIFGKRYQIVEVKHNLDASIIYININTFNNLNNQDQIYCILATNNNPNNIKAINGVMINTKLFNLSSIKAFSYITSFIIFFAILLIVLAYITSLITFSFNLFQKKKDILILKRLGVYEHKIFSLFLYEPLINILTSVLSCILSIVVSKFMISILYYNMTFQSLDIKLSISFLISIIFIPFFAIIPLIIFKIIRFINKNI
jgi:ABC-type antimicrobial peptide transport system permease subunit